MFKYKNGKPVGVIFVDYQMSYYSSPGLDLNYFINTSPSNEIRENQIDDILHVYYDNFSAVLKSLGAKHIPSMSDVRIEIERCEYYGLMAGRLWKSFKLRSGFPEFLYNKHMIQINSDSLGHSAICRSA